MSTAAPTSQAAPNDAENGVVKPLLELRNLKTYFFTADGVSKAVDGVSFSIAPRETLGLVGESGCGKSVTALSILRLIPQPPGRIVEGEAWFKGCNLFTLPERQMREVRGNQISMIFQEPMTSLNPVFTIGSQVAEVFQVHRNMRRAQAMEEAARMLDLVRIPAALGRLRDYPHQMSGGMRQRVMIAMALACDPDLLIADEPTTALDVTVQAQILELMESLKHKVQSSILMITHDLGVIAEICDHVAVMYAGQIVEKASVKDLFRRPAHPYSQGLLEAIPRRDMLTGGKTLRPIPGGVPSPSNFPSGCRFHPRCPFSAERCYKENPDLAAVAGPAERKAEATGTAAAEEHLARCHFAKEIASGTQPRHAPKEATAG